MGHRDGQPGLRVLGAGPRGLTDGCKLSEQLNLDHNSRAQAPFGRVLWNFATGVCGGFQQVCYYIYLSVIVYTQFMSGLYQPGQWKYFRNKNIEKNVMVNCITGDF